MKIALTAVLILTLNQAVFAETQANSGSFDDIEYGPPEELPPAPAKFKPAGKTRAVVPVDIKPATQAAQVAPVEKIEATIHGEGCPEPAASQDASKTPVEVWVDQDKQTITIHTPDRKTDLVDKVSTGGGLKIPNGKLKKSPYCARTPKMDRVISAVKVDDFAHTSCTPDQKRDRSTVFPMYYSRTFTDKNGRLVPMPKAIRIDGGIFFHVVPPSYKGLLGHNVSGECVRLNESTATFLQAQINKYGAIKVHISEPPVVDRDMPQYCDEQMVAQAKFDQQNGRVSPAMQQTGSEGVIGGEKSAEDIFAKVAQKLIDPFGILGVNKDGIAYRGGQNSQAPRPKAEIPQS
jgi:hypothetical protein